MYVYMYMYIHVNDLKAVTIKMKIKIRQYKNIENKTGILLVVVPALVGVAVLKLIVPLLTLSLFSLVVL